MITLIAICMAAAAVILVAWPLIQAAQTRAPQPSQRDQVLDELLARREAALTAIKDLEFDYLVGKIEEADYQALDARLRSEAIAILKAIDQHTGIDSGEASARLEREIARKRHKSAAPQPAPSLEAQVEAEIAALRRQSATPGTRPAARPATMSCASCGAALDAADRFCRNCGAPTRPPDGAVPSQP